MSLSNAAAAPARVSKPSAVGRVDAVPVCGLSSLVILARGTSSGRMASSEGASPFGRSGCFVKGTSSSVIGRSGCWGSSGAGGVSGVVGVSGDGGVPPPPL